MELAQRPSLERRGACHRGWGIAALVTATATANGCWDPDGVDLDALDPIFFDFASGRANQKARFGGELFLNVVESDSGLEFAEFSRTNATVAAKASSS
jgi:hypothetical protein